MSTWWLRLRKGLEFNNKIRKEGMKGTSLLFTLNSKAERQKAKSATPKPGWPHKNTPRQPASQRLAVLWNPEDRNLGPKPGKSGPDPKIQILTNYHLTTLPSSASS